MPAPGPDRRLGHTSPMNMAAPASMRVSVSTAVGVPVGVVAADVDRDGDMDVLSASFLGAKVAWHENVAGDGSASSTAGAVRSTGSGGLFL